jgi:hypothetical protein
MHSRTAKEAHKTPNPNLTPPVPLYGIIRPHAETKADPKEFVDVETVQEGPIDLTVGKKKEIVD